MAVWRDPQNSRFSDPSQIRLEKGKPIPETIVVPREAFLISLKRIFPGVPPAVFMIPPRVPNALPLPSLRGWGPSESSLLFIYGGFPFYPPGPRRASPSPGKKVLAAPLLRAWPPPRRDVPTPAQCFTFRKSSAPCRPPVPERSYKFQIIIMDTPEVNAFAAPGGSIVVFRGLLEKVQTTEEFGRDPGSRNAAYSAPPLDANALRACLFGTSPWRDHGRCEFGHEDRKGRGGPYRGSTLYPAIRRTADAEGMRLILAAGIDPGGMISFLEKIQKEDGKTTAMPAYFSTHPSPESRIEKLKILAGDPRNQTFRPLAPYDWKKIQGACGKKP